MYISTHIFKGIKPLIFLLGVFAITFSFASAQFTQQNNRVSLQISPENPAPNSRVTAMLSAPAGSGLDRASITWRVGGNQEVSGRGETRISFTTPGLGEQIVVRVAADIPGLGVVERTRTITPTEVDILWEAPNTYTPPFYKGKALPASEAVIRVTAVPHLPTEGGGRIAAENAVYKWQRDFRYRDFNDQSGYGARTITYRKQLLDDTDRITTEVSSLNESVRGVSTVVLPAFTPQVLFYEDHPLYGPQYHRAFSNTFGLINQEATLIVEPFFFSVRTPASLDIVWKMNGEEVSTEQEDRGNELTLRAGEGSGEVQFEISATHPTQILQLLNKTLTVAFGDAASEAQKSPFTP